MESVGDSLYIDKTLMLWLDVSKYNKTNKGENMPEQGPEDTPNEPTAAEQIQKGQELTEYQDALTLDISNPEDPEFTPEQQRNIEIMDGLLNMYPHALVEHTTQDGRGYLTLKNDAFMNVHNYNQKSVSSPGAYENYKSVNLALSYRGITAIRASIPGAIITDLSSYDLTPVLDVDIYSRDSGDPRPELTLRNEKGSTIVLQTVTHVGYERADLGALKTLLTMSEEFHKNDVEPKILTAQEILDSL
jgi:hypothetical protein